MRKWIMLAAAGALLAGCGTGTQSGGGTASAPGEATKGTAPAQEHLLALNVKEGQKYTYNGDIKGDGVDASFQVSMAVTKVEGDQVTMESAIESMKTGGQETPAEMLKTARSTSVMDRTTKTIQGSGGAAASMGALVTFPDKPIRVGESWESESAVMGNRVKTTNKFVAVEEVNGMKAAHIQVTVPKQPTVNMDKPIDMWFEFATGMLIKMEMSAHHPENPAQKMNAVMTRV
jgi:hypothetical protein